MSANVNWEAIYEIDLRTGFAPDPKSFTETIMDEIPRILEYDEGMCLYFDGNGKISDTYSRGIKQEWISMYLEYYATTAGGQYSADRHMQENPAVHSLIGLRDWTREPLNEFTRDYIHARGIKHSIGIPLFDINGLKRVQLAFDRVTDRPFTQAEKMNLLYLKPLLNNQFKKYYYRSQKPSGKEKVVWSDTDLTAREIEVADLLCQGISPANISKILHISKATSYKHIAHIYEKMNVTSRQALLVKLLQ